MPSWLPQSSVNRGSCPGWPEVGHRWPWRQSLTRLASSDFIQNVCHLWNVFPFINIFSFGTLWIVPSRVCDSCSHGERKQYFLLSTWPKVWHARGWAHSFLLEPHFLFSPFTSCFSFSWENVCVTWKYLFCFVSGAFLVFQDNHNVDLRSNVAFDNVFAFCYLCCKIEWKWTHV